MNDTYGSAQISIDQSSGSTNLEAGAVAEIRYELTEEHQPAIQHHREKFFIPIGRSIKPVDVRLRVGEWSLKVEFPTGYIERSNFVVREGKINVVKVLCSPLEDTVLSNRHVVSRKFGNRLALPKKLAPWIATGLETIGLDNLEGDGFLAKSIKSLTGIGRSSGSVAILECGGSKQITWKTIIEFQSSNEQAADLEIPTFAEMPLQSDGRSAQFTVPPLPNQPSSRFWGLLKYDDTLSLVALPWPWGSNSDQSREGFIHGSASFGPDNKTNIRVFVDDPMINVMLSYLIIDQLDNAALIVEQARSKLYDKISNPVAAAGGGYVLLATSLRGEDLEWRSWIANLADWFEFVPDGAILEGSMLLNGPKEMRDFERAAERFLQAYDRGLPFYTVGISWLLSGLRVLRAQYPQLEEPYTHVKKIATMTDLTNPFTTLRLPARSVRET